MKTQIHPERCDDESVQASDNSHVSTQKVEISERTLSVIAFGLAVAAFVTALWSMHESEIRRVAENREIDRLVREVHVCTVTTENHDALMIRAGFKRPEDYPRGPTGNLEYHPPGEK